MAISFEKNKDTLISAWKDVLDDKTSTNWALFGYEGMSNDLRLVSKGADGVEEMVEDLNSGKIMYAFLKVTDPKTSLPKNVLVNWQGEGAPTVRKGTCANHIRDVGNFFKGAHVTLNARTEEEIDLQIIIDKVSKSTGSVYKFNERAEPTNDSGPVGTTYKRTIPKQEINALERDRFWEKQEEEERQRQENERQRREIEAKRLEEERRKRDSEETALRETKIRETTKNIDQIRLAEKASFERSQVTKSQPVEEIEKEEVERQNRADILRRQRSEEAQSLISKRTIDARAIFEQNTAAGQFKQRRSSVQPRGGYEASPGQRRSSEVQLPVTERVKCAEPAETAPTPVIKEVTEPAPLSTPAVGNGVNGGSTHPVCEEEAEPWEDEVKHEIPITNIVAEDLNAAEDHLLLPPEQFINGDYGLTARALYDYQAGDETEITFDPGDVITHIDQIDEGWWQGLGPDGTYGLFPANYVELIK